MTELEQKVEQVLDEAVNPKLREHKGWVELVMVDESDVAVVRFRGACSNCDSIYQTLEEQVAPAILTAVPQIVRVEVDDGVDAGLIDLARSLLGGGKEKSEDGGKPK